MLSRQRLAELWAVPSRLASLSGVETLGLQNTRARRTASFQTWYANTFAWNSRSLIATISPTPDRSSFPFQVTTRSTASP